MGEYYRREAVGAARCRRSAVDAEIDLRAVNAERARSSVQGAVRDGFQRAVNVPDFVTDRYDERAATDPAVVPHARG